MTLIATLIHTAVVAFLLLGASTTARADTPEQRRARYEAYLDLDKLVANASPEPQWLADGRLTFTTDGGRKLFDPRSGAVSDDTRARPDMKEGTFKRAYYSYPALRAEADVASPDGRRFATVRDGDLYLRSAAGGDPVRLTHDAKADIIWDLDSGRLIPRPIPTADPWSPDGKRLYATQVDRGQVRRGLELHFLGDVVTSDAKYSESPDAPLPHARPAIIDADLGATTFLDLGDSHDQIFTFLGWRPDGSEVLFSRIPRDFRSIDVLAADPKTGKVRVILSEHSKSFIRIQHEVLYAEDVGFTPLPDGSGFLWLSERDGWKHIYLYDYQGRLVRRLTSGAYPVVGIGGVDLGAHTVFFTAHGDRARPYDTQFYRVPLGGGSPVRLTVGPGQHEAVLSPTKAYFSDIVSSVADGPELQVRDARGRLIRTLSHADLAKLRAKGFRPPEEFTVKAADGVTDLWGVIYFPADFDPSKRYPVIERIYAGPQTTYAPRAFTALPYRLGNYELALAQLGYLVVTVDGRGTPERSKAFQDYVYGRMGQVELADHVAALHALAAQKPYVDLDHTAIFGHSWGGQFAFRALVEAPDLYKAAVSSGPDYAGNNMLVEPYIGPLAENRAAYEAFSLFKLAPKVHAPLMMIAGSAEFPMFHDALRMSAALIEAGVQHELILMPEQSHGYSGKGAEYVMQATTRFFETHLPPEGADHSGATEILR